jgi:molybdate transport system ATP-binding protein
LDVVDRNLAIEVIRSRTEGRALICVTHSVENAAALCESLMVVDRGKILQTGSLDEVLSLPSDDRVAAIAGIRNVVHAQVVSRAGDLATVAAKQARFVVVADADVGSDVVISIGAEAIAVYATQPGPSSMRNVIKGAVSAIAQRGRLVEVTMGEDPGLAALVTPGALDALEIEVGSTVWFGVKTAAIRMVRS